MTNLECIKRFVARATGEELIERLVGDICPPDIYSEDCPRDYGPDAEGGCTLENGDNSEDVCLNCWRHWLEQEAEGTFHYERWLGAGKDATK